MMKVSILAVTLAAVAGAGLQNAYAGDREWATAGKVLTGVVAGSLLVRALEPAPQPVYAPLVCESPRAVYVVPQQTTVVYQQPVVQQAMVQTTTTTTSANGEQTTTVVTQPTQTIVQPAPVYVQPAPVVYAPAPVVYMPAPRPFISVGLWGGPHYGPRPYYGYGYGPGYGYGYSRGHGRW